MTAFTFRDLAFVSGRSTALLYPSYVQDYLDRVIAADVAAGNTQGLELAVTDAISTCLQALVADGILGVSGGVLAQAPSLVKASCAMQGARTLSGALVPLAADMPAPTNFNFVAGDYTRRTGLTGNGTTKYLNSNYMDNTDPQNDAHLSVYVAQAGTGGANTSMSYAGVSRSVAPASLRLITRFNSFGGITAIGNYNRTGSAAAGINLNATGFLGNTRSASSSYIRRGLGVDIPTSGTSSAPAVASVAVFASNNEGSGVSRFANCQLSFYTIGRALDLAILDARITALSNAIQAAIAP